MLADDIELPISLTLEEASIIALGHSAGSTNADASTATDASTDTDVSTDTHGSTNIDASIKTNEPTRYGAFTENILERISMENRWNMERSENILIFFFEITFWKRKRLQKECFVFFFQVKQPKNQ
jgi:hypothetical protein